MEPKRSFKEKEQFKKKMSGLSKRMLLQPLLQMNYGMNLKTDANSFPCSTRPNKSPSSWRLLKCGKCGWNEYRLVRFNKNRYRVYRCSANKNKGTCTSKQYKAHQLEELFKKDYPIYVNHLAFHYILHYLYRKDKQT